VLPLELFEALKTRLRSVRDQRRMQREA
jgi:hypothetical protein